MQIRERSPSLMKENLLMMLGYILVFLSVILAFKSLILGNLLFIIGLALSIYSIYKQYSLGFKQQHIVTKFTIVRNTIFGGVYLLIFLIILFIINLVL